MFRRLLIAFSLCAFAAAPVAAFAQAKTADKKPAAASAFTDKQRAELDARMKQFIMDNPQVLIDSVEAYYNKQNETKEKQEGRMETPPAGLLDNPSTPFIGPKDAKFVMVEFFDYNCGYCKQVAPDVSRFAKEEPGVKIIFKELPILSETSETAARYALAAQKQGKYIEFHDALMAHQGGISEMMLETTAKNLKLDVEQLKKDANTQEVRDQLAKNVALARELGVRGTPFFVMGKEKVPGAIGYSRMREIYARESGIAPSVAPAAPAAPAADDSKKEDDSATSAAPAAAPTATPSLGSADAALDAELKKAQDETKAMIEDIKKQALEMQKAAEAAQKAQAESASGTAAEKAAKEAIEADKKK